MKRQRGGGKIAPWWVEWSREPERDGVETSRKRGCMRRQERAAGGSFWEWRTMHGRDSGVFVTWGEDSVRREGEAGPGLSGWEIAGVFC